MLHRRDFLSICTAAGFGGTLLPGTLFALASQTAPAGQPLAEITEEMVRQAAELAGVTTTAEQRRMMLAGLKSQREGYAPIRALNMPNSQQPAFVFDPTLSHPEQEPAGIQRQPTALGPAEATAQFNGNLEKLAFASVRELGDLIRTRQITSVALTEMYLSRLQKANKQLHCVITLLPERAMRQARTADAEAASGRFRGPLHGIPWGVKDLLAVAGAPTTWGAAGYEQQSFERDATVVERLDAAGAVLIAKLSLGSLAMNDIWFGGRTRNPWNLDQGSSGSSAGSAAATAAGCVGFSIGSETLGSISSPSTRCGDSGFRPTFGFVPRTGAMALSWTMDKLGPICRAAQDCALVMQAIYGPDGHDFSARNKPFAWDGALDWKTLRVGYFADEIDGGQGLAESAMVAGLPAGDPAAAEKQRRARELAHRRREYDRRYDVATLELLRAQGFQLKPIKLPELPYDAIANLLTAEGAAAFDPLTMSGRDKLLTGQTPDDWPNLFRIARLYPAVEYIQAMRARAVAVQQVSALFADIDIIVAASGAEQLTVTNLTGHPAVIVPNGLRGQDAPAPATLEEDNDTDDAIGGPGTPTSITFLAKHYDDARLLAFAFGYQQHTSFHQNHPPGFAV